MKPRHGKWLAAGIVLLVIALALVLPSALQNLAVRGHIGALLHAVQQQDRTRLQNAFYPLAELDEKYFDVMFAHRLYGWTITDVTGQPWPTDTGKLESVKINLYMALPASMVKPQGAYETVRNKYGPCAVVPVTLRFRHLKDGSWFIYPPHFDQAIDWPCPYTVPEKPPTADAAE
ncbi:MAG TPA: hypothetical protein PLZ36_07635 [Armatimonadota bacterium]|nr:hypothetical protein [Armatimonadota bacterium]HOS43637.1 hypothetical protein [Armatimonadota bacterium]